MRIILVTWLMISFSVFTINNIYPQIQYEVIDIGSLGGNYSVAYDLNEAGQVVGWSFNANNDLKAFLWQNGTLIELGHFGGEWSLATGINDSGYVVGGSLNALGNERPFLWYDGNMIDLGTLGGPHGGALGINNLNQIVGSSYDSEKTFRATIWQNGTINSLPGGGTNTQATSINDSGWIAGNSLSNGLYMPVFWIDGNYIELGNFGATFSSAYDLNDHKQIVGNYSNSSNVDRAFIWEDGVMTDIGPGFARGINNSGQVVGKTDSNKAFIWKDGILTELNNLIDPSLGWNLVEATAISERGQIVGSGILNGQSKAFLLNPFIITNPVIGDKWISGTTDTIRWIGGRSGNLLELQYSVDNGNTFQLIDFGVEVDSGYYVWDIPDTLLSTRAKIKLIDMVNSANTSVSDTFKLKPYVITRLDENGDYVAYDRNTDKWGFRNDTTGVWTSSWWNQFNYRGIDPFTGSQYSQWQAKRAFNKASASDHVDWVSWVNTFGVNACYHSTSFGIYNVTAVQRWKSITNNWNGSCFGIAAANALAFSFRTEFQSKYPNFPSFVNPITIISDTAVKKVINELYAHQFGNPSIANDDVSKNIKTPNQTLNELKQMLNKDIVEPQSLTIFNNNGSGAHTILAFGVRRDPNLSNIYYLDVYDNSYPNSTNPITIDTLGNSNNGVWNTPDWSTWGGSNNIYLEVIADKYLNNASFIDGNESLFILPEGRLEVSNNGKSAISIIDSLGNITGNLNNKIYNNIPGSLPRVLKNGSETLPYAYNLQSDNYFIKLDNFISDTISLAVFTGNKTFTIERTDANNAQTDNVFFDGGFSFSNPDAETKNIEMMNILNETTQEKVFILRDLSIEQNDSLKIENVNDDQLRMSNYGTAKNYEIELNFAAETGLGRFGYSNISLDPNTSHNYVPDWNDITNTDLMVLVDVGNNGTIDDTLYLQNQVTGIGNDQGSLLSPNSYNLAQNYPNPFNTATIIQYSIPQRSNVTLKFYDVLGKEVAELVNEVKERGVYTVNFDGSRLASGIYFYQLRSGDYAAVKKMILIK